MSYAGYMEAQCTVPSAVTLTATNNGGGPTAVSVTAGTYYISELVGHLQTVLNAQRAGSGGATWTVSISLTGSSPTGRVTISMSAGTFSITWTTAALGTILGHDTITTQTSVTGNFCSPGVWCPQRPLAGGPGFDPRIAQLVTDHRETEGPTGSLFAVGGNEKYVIGPFHYAHVERARTWDHWDDSGGTSNWERFIKNAHLGSGHAWFSRASRIRVYDHTGVHLGSETSEAELSWKIRGIRGTSPQQGGPRKMSDAWTGSWMIEFPMLVSDGS